MKAQYKRIILKLSGEMLSGDGGFGFDKEAFDSVTHAIISVYQLEAMEVGIVVGGGNVFRGSQKFIDYYGIQGVAGDHIGMLATMMNSLLLQQFLENNGIKTRVMSGIEANAVAEPYIQRRAIRHLEKGRVVIFAAGCGQTGITTDSAALFRAREVGADIVIKATKIDGVYDKDPMVHENALRYSCLSYNQMLTQNLRVMDSTSIGFGQDNDVPIMVVNINSPDTLVKAVCGENVGTLISSQNKL